MVFPLISYPDTGSGTSGFGSSQRVYRPYGL